jgi:hypothetical protein
VEDHVRVVEVPDHRVSGVKGCWLEIVIFVASVPFGL